MYAWMYVCIHNIDDREHPLHGLCERPPKVCRASRPIQSFQSGCHVPVESNIAFGVLSTSLGRETLKKATLVLPCCHTFCEACLDGKQKECADCEKPIKSVAENHTVDEVCAKFTYQKQAIAALQEMVPPSLASSRRGSIR